MTADRGADYRQRLLPPSPRRLRLATNIVPPPNGARHQHRTLKWPLEWDWCGGGGGGGSSPLSAVQR